MNETQFSNNGETTKQIFVKPRYEIEQQKDAYLVRVYTPGATRNGVNITHEKDTLTIIATREKRYPETWKPISREIQSTDYQLRLQLNVPINDQAVAAKLENGVLDVVLPLAEKAKPRKIAIK